jgi:hypothetical protein
MFTVDRISPAWKRRAAAGRVGQRNEVDLIDLHIGRVME